MTHFFLLLCFQNYQEVKQFSKFKYLNVQLQCAFCFIPYIDYKYVLCHSLTFCCHGSSSTLLQNPSQSNTSCFGFLAAWSSSNHLLQSPENLLPVQISSVSLPSELNLTVWFLPWTASENCGKRRENVLYKRHKVNPLRTYCLISFWYKSNCEFYDI